MDEDARKNGSEKMRLINSKGNLNPQVAIIIGLLGGAVAVLPLYFELDPYLVVGGYFIGMILMGFSSIALKSSTLDLRAFTNDPLGWRAAKASYESKNEGQKDSTEERS
jgi:hypothetical protein